MISMKLKVLSIIIIIVLLPVSGKIFAQETEKSEVFFIAVNEARSLAISNSFDVKLARLDSQIKGTELSYKKAIFDTILNGKIDYSDDQLKPSSSIPGTKNITNNYNIGIGKKLRSGTDVSIDLTNKREWTNSAFASVNPYHDSTIEIDVTQPIAKNSFGLLDRGDIEIVKWEIKNAELDSYIKIEDSLISAEKAYWKMALAQEEFRIKKQMFKKAVRLFSQYRWKLKVGLVETGDVLASEANMHIRENELLIALNELKSAEELLKLHLNIKKEIKLITISSLSDARFNRNFIESLAMAFENRRDYISIKNDIEAKDIKLEMKSNSRFPEIDLRATFTTNGLDSAYYRAMEGVIEDSNPKYYFGIEFKYPLENNSSNSLYEKAALEKTKAILNLQKREREIISDIDNSFRKFSVNRTSISKMERVQNLQEGKLFQEEQKFKYGRSGSDTLIRYQEDLLNAKLNTQKAYFDYKVSILDLMNAEDSFLKTVGLE